jgi:hypothetical protein
MLFNNKEYNQFHYFDKRSNEEDLPVSVGDSTQNKYEELEAIFDEFFEDNSLTLAKVKYFLIIAKFKRGKRQERTQRFILRVWRDNLQVTSLHNRIHKSSIW